MSARTLDQIERAGWHRHTNGGGWVEDTAAVDPSAQVSGNAQVFGNARVFGDSKISGYAVIPDAHGLVSAIIGGYSCDAWRNASGEVWVRYGCVLLRAAKWATHSEEVAAVHEPEQAATYARYTREWAAFAAGLLEQVQSEGSA